MNVLYGQNATISTIEVDLIDDRKLSKSQIKAVELLPPHPPGAHGSAHRPARRRSCLTKMSSVFGELRHRRERGVLG